MPGGILAIIDVDDEAPVSLIVEHSVKIGDDTIQPEQVLMCDPRCVVAGVDPRTVFYNPREHRQASWVDEWLREHPEWPGVLELDT